MLLKRNPKVSVMGVGVNVGADARPSARTLKTSILLPFLSVTTSQLPFGEKLTWAGSTDGPLSACVEFANAVSLPLASTVNPVIMSTAPWAPPAFST